MHVKLFTLILILVGAIMHGQTKTYVIKVAGVKVGNLYATHSKSNSFDYYVTKSNVEVSFARVKIDTKTESVYNNGVLVKSVVTSTINGKPYTSKTTWEKDHYKIDCNTHKYAYKDSTLKKPIVWSVSRLYFEKPAPGTEVYAESYGKHGKIIQQADKSLKLVAPESKHIYFYSDENKLLKLEIVNSIKNFEIIAE